MDYQKFISILTEWDDKKLRTKLCELSGAERKKIDEFITMVLTAEAKIAPYKAFAGMFGKILGLRVVALTWLTAESLFDRCQHIQKILKDINIFNAPFTFFKDLF